MFTALTRMVCNSHTRPSFTYIFKETAVLQMLALLTFATFTTLTQAATPFTTNGKFSVGSDGSANYSIPIQVPPGTAGMAPTLSLNYNSNGGNGILGMGWGLDGLSQISRCPKKKIKDGVNWGVNYDQYDKFCIDGEGLVSTGGTYGAHGTEYRTETANFAKIISYTSNIANGPDYFKVWTKSGQIIEYGNTVDSRVEAAGKTAVRTWGANKISDTKGNYLTVTYIEDGANGEAYVSRVDYTGNAAASLTPYASIRFTYENRPDTSTAYHVGSFVKSTKRMTSIKTYNGNAVVKDYRLTYTNSLVTNRSQLATLTECDGNTSTPICLTPKQFGMRSNFNGVSNFNGESNAGEQLDLLANTYADFANDSMTARVTSIDMDGDGLEDVLLGPTSGGNWRLVKSTGTTLVDQGIVGNGYGDLYAQPDRFRQLDMNGDGLTDILVGPTSGGNWFWMRNTGTGFINESNVKQADAPVSTPFNGYGNYYESPGRIRVMDVNGDGLQDLFIGPSSTGKWDFVENTKNGFIDHKEWFTGYSEFSDYSKRIHQMDVDGDGLQDILIGPKSNGEWYFVRNTGYGFIDKGTVKNYGQNTPFIGYGIWHDKTNRIRQFDVNGDGLKDFLLGPLSTGEWYSIINTGAGFIDGQLWYNGFGNWYDNTSRIRVVDTNGDGREEILLGPKSDGSWILISQAGTNPVAANESWATGIFANWATESGAARTRVMDVNGDGFMDVVVGPSSSGYWGALVSKSAQHPDRLASIGDGADTLRAGVAPWYEKNTHTVTYAPLTNKSIYTKGSIGEAGTTTCPQPTGSSGVTNDYPILNLQLAQSVVSSVSVLDGVGTRSTSNYSYGGYKVDLSGHGSLGFRYQTVTESPDDTRSTTFYRQDYPLIGMPCQSENYIHSNNNIVSAAQTIYSSATLLERTNQSTVVDNTAIVGFTLKSIFPYVTETIQQSFELGNTTAISTTKTNNQYDTFGNVTQVKVDSMDGHVKTTNNTYYNDSTNWILGRLVRSTVSSTNPYTTPTVTVPTAPPPSNASPTVALTAPTNGSSVASGTAITVSATAADSDGTISKVEFFDGTTLIGTDTTSPYSMSWSGAAVGSHSITAKATDNANAVTTSGAVSLTITSGSGGSGTTGLLSQGKTTSQSTTLAQPQRGEAYRAVDGNTNGAWQWNSDTNSLSHTASETESQAWWQVDLGEAATISQVKLWNRTDCCGERLANFYVFVSATDMTGRTLAQLTADSTVSKQQVSSLNGAASLVVEMGNASGRYVRVQLAGTGYLTLAEVQVYGTTGGGTPPPANVNPTVSLTAPANNGSAASGTAITVSATAADSDGTISKVEFFDGTTLIGTDTTAPYSISWTGATVGAHSLTAKATDNANAVTTSSAVSFSVTTGSSGTNTLLSQGKTTSQSSTLAQPQRGEAYRAVDGNTNGAWQWNSDTNSLSHTNSETESQAWWQVDLGQSSIVNQVKLWNRTDCCGDRLSNFYVFISTTDMTGRTLDQLVADNTVIKQQVSSLNGAASLTLEMGGVSGRYVRVQRTGVGYLTLAEVQVYGQ